MKNNKGLSNIQLAMLFIHSQVGVGVVTLPYDVFLKANGDAWISVLIAGVIVQIYLILFGMLMNRFPNSNVYEIVIILFGKVVGRIIIILYCLYLIFIGSEVIARFAYLLKAWMMPMTPNWVLLALMGFTCYYIVKEKIYVMGRFFVLASLVFIGFILASFYALKFADITFILPIASEGMTPIWKGVTQSLFSFQGFGFLLIIFPYAQANTKGVLKIATWSNIFITFFYTLVVFVCLLFFSPHELKLVPEPLLYMVKSFSFRILERPDLLFTSMWIVLVATTFMCKVYSASIGLSIMFNAERHGKFALVMVVICFIVALFFNEEREIDKAINLLDVYLIPTFAILPIFFLLVSIIFKKKEQVGNE